MYMSHSELLIIAGPVSSTDLCCIVHSCSGSLAPVIAYDKSGIRILLHYGRDRPRPDVEVMALSTMSTNTCPITNFSFQAAVPKVRLTLYLQGLSVL